MTQQGALVADLHMHSTASDGCLDVEQILEACKDTALTHIAITDHDALAGSRRARELAAHADAPVIIPGVEISTQTESRDVHLLGYFFDLENKDLNSFFASNRANREERACRIADNMAEDGFPVSGEMMRTSGRTINRTLLARMLVEAGEASSTDDAYSRLIGRKSKYYVENVKCPTVEAIRLIREAGGFPVVAHPALYRVVDLIVPFKREGLHGVEAFHTLQTPEQTEALITLAADEGLAVSGGSDWHGDSTHGSSLASAGLDASQLEAFLHSCGAL